MAKIKPFQGYRPSPNMAASVSSPPYDVMTSDEARVVAQNNPLSFLRVIKPEIDLKCASDVPVFKRRTKLAYPDCPKYRYPNSSNWGALKNKREKLVMDNVNLLHDRCVSKCPNGWDKFEFDVLLQRHKKCAEPRKPWKNPCKNME